MFSDANKIVIGDEYFILQNFTGKYPDCLLKINFQKEKQENVKLLITRCLQKLRNLQWKTVK